MSKYNSITLYKNNLLTNSLENIIKIINQNIHNFDTQFNSLSDVSHESIRLLHPLIQVQPV